MASLEADFQAVYGLDLRAVLWGPDAVGCRRLLALVECLPASSATAVLSVAPSPEPAPVPAGPGAVRDAVREFFGKGG